MEAKPAANEKFSQLIRSTSEIISSSMSLIDDSKVRESVSLIKKSRRIFCMGSGSSHPSAWSLAQGLSAELGFCARIIGLSEFIATESLSSSDLLILVSQGFNRADAQIAVKFAASKQASLILITASPLEAPEASVHLRFLPTYESERIFCRPVGVITSLLISQMILSALKEARPLTAASVCSLIEAADNLREEVNSAKEKIQDAERVIVLSSGLLAPAASNVALTLREGAAIAAEYYEIEFYAHGQYAGHLNPWKNKGIKTAYLLIASSRDSVSERSLSRIKPLLVNTGVPFNEWIVDAPPSAASIIILRLGALLTESILKDSGYDMNNPIGKEENRGFQEVSPYYYRSTIR